ncbi:CRISPR-associated endonuclease Cas1 [Paracoccus rhizosphaerae]|uniref:CRISPR-associated endonuclease Cas1 n=1 Tax=Paracoccus rhizosphaerae TaxID=1133347 RepID=A0ABV6CU92_9RHOB|nr:CRISPR-associated endonuclease Cas1 [Paracoccus rhizosphaerae]
MSSRPAETEPIPLSAVQHAVYCLRQAALIHLERNRLALSLVNRRQLRAGDFRPMDGGAVLLTDDARKLVLTAWQERKKEERMHPFLAEKAPFGLVPYLQAQMLARHLRGDIDAYPPWFWS